MVATKSPMQWFAILLEQYPDIGPGRRWKLAYSAYSALGMTDAIRQQAEAWQATGREDQERAQAKRDAERAAEKERQRQAREAEDQERLRRVAEAAEAAKHRAVLAAKLMAYIPPGPDRNAKIVSLRAEGLTLQAIGDRFGIGKEQVRKILAKAEQVAAHQGRVRNADKNLEARLAALQIDARRPIRFRVVKADLDFTGARTPEDEWRAIQAGR